VFDFIALYPKANLEIAINIHDLAEGKKYMEEVMEEMAKSILSEVEARYSQEQHKELAEISYNKTKKK